jgi:hypothetical protein
MQILNDRKLIKKGSGRRAFRENSLYKVQMGFLKDWPEAGHRVGKRALK